MLQTVELLTTSELGRILGLGPRTIQAMVESQQIPFRRLPSTHLRFHPREIVDWLRAKKADVPLALLARIDENPLAGFSREHLEEDLKRRGLDYREAMERLARGDIPGPKRGNAPAVPTRIKRFAQRVLTGDMRQVSS